ncbi:DUF2721 domain-containing protein [Pelagerythrobacter sp.]|uniref:DUF2721 domain-containing protein n=1 Tax=Pelagerythrobacter sp. TaxID=2800702 RepID=UPI0035ADD63C
MVDLLSASTSLAVEMLQRTASTPHVQQIVQLSLAPAFLLSGIGAIMNVMMSRMIWVAERIERIERRIEDGKAGDHELRELPWLVQRRRHAQKAMAFSTASAAVISVVIALLFISAYIEPQIGTITAIAWVLTMALLITGLGFFLLETRMAARGVNYRGWRNRKTRR